MDRKIPDIVSVSRELFSYTFKQVKKTKKESKLKQEYKIGEIEYNSNKAEFKLSIKQYHLPSNYFKTQAEYNIVITFSKEIKQEMFGDEIQKEIVENSIEDAFADNSFLLSFFTDRVFDSPLILPPFPMDKLKSAEEE